ncbi:MAG: hypothetical protein ACLTR8_03260 [Oscillospiraceae bacterium]
MNGVDERHFDALEHGDRCRADAGRDAGAAPGAAPASDPPGNGRGWGCWDGMGLG